MHLASAYGTSALIKFAARGFMICGLTSGRATQAATATFDVFVINLCAAHWDDDVEFSLVDEVVSTIAMMFSDMFTRSMYDTKHARKSCVAISALTGIKPKEIKQIIKFSIGSRCTGLPFGKILNCIFVVFFWPGSHALYF